MSWFQRGQRFLLGAVLLAAPMAQAEESPFVVFEGPQLQQGRSIWMANCRNCHGDGTAGAPIPMEPEAWRPRITKARSLLYEHALHGFFGPDGTMMPERGGNPKLTDAEVKAAVDYMIALARHYLAKTQ